MNCCWPDPVARWSVFLTVRAVLAQESVRSPLHRIVARLIAWRGVSRHVVARRCCCARYRARLLITALVRVWVQLRPRLTAQLPAPPRCWVHSRERVQAALPSSLFSELRRARQRSADAASSTRRLRREPAPACATTAAPCGRIAPAASARSVRRLCCKTEVCSDCVCSCATSGALRVGSAGSTGCTKVRAATTSRPPADPSARRPRAALAIAPIAAATTKTRAVRRKFGAGAICPIRD